LEETQRKAAVNNNKITLVTFPDDVLHDGIRILIFDLTPAHTQLISGVLYNMKEIQNTVIYVSNGQDDTQWALDKKQKCSIILYNAESQNQTMVGYLTAQSNSYYFGELKTLSSVNNNKIISKEQIEMIMEDQYKKYAKL
jgi:hypothetical protein